MRQVRNQQHDSHRMILKTNDRNGWRALESSLANREDLRACKEPLRSRGGLDGPESLSKATMNVVCDVYWARAGVIRNQLEEFQ
jgi:hypothetical protein